MSWLWPVTLTVAAVVALAEMCALLALMTGLAGLVVRTSPRYRVAITEDGPDIGTPLPPIEGTDVGSEEPIAATEFRGRKLALLFVSPTCGICDNLLAAVAHRRRRIKEEIVYLFVVQALPEETRCYLERLPGVPALADPKGEIAGVCGVERRPIGLLVDPEGVVRMKGIVNTLEQLAGLIAAHGRSIVGITWDQMGAGKRPLV